MCSLSVGYILRTRTHFKLIDLRQAFDSKINNVVYAYAKAKLKKQSYDNMSQNK